MLWWNTYKAHWVLVSHALQVPPMEVEVTETQLHQRGFWYGVPRLLQDTANIQQVLGNVHEQVSLRRLSSEKIPEWGIPVPLFDISNAVR